MKKMTWATALLVLGCNVESTDEGTGGVKVSDGECGGGVVALLSDYLSTQVALLKHDGTPLSESFLSSGSTKASGLSAPLSGDVTAPSSRALSREVVLLDRFGTNVLSWVRPDSGEVRAQLPVGTGFESNPRDYVEISAHKAYVPRWGENADPGYEPYDGGGDVLILDPTVPTITGSIDLHGVSELPPRPTSVTLLGTTAVVVLQRLALDYASQGDSELVGIDTRTDQIEWRTTLSGLKGCGAAVLSPSGARLALACTGDIDSDGQLRDPEATGIVLLDAASHPPAELQRFDIYGELGFSPQPELAFAAEELVLGKTQTPYMGEGNNQLFAFALETKELRVLAEAAPNDDGTGKGIVFGSLHCSPSCSSSCLVADAESFSVRRFDSTAAFEELEPVILGADSGLPPVGLGVF